MSSLECPECGHSESWESGNYFGEKLDFAHHVCGSSGRYAMCGPKCDHIFPGCSLTEGHPAFSVEIAKVVALDFSPILKTDQSRWEVVL